MRHICNTSTAGTATSTEAVTTSTDTLTGRMRCRSRDTGHRKSDQDSTES